MSSWEDIGPTTRPGLRFAPEAHFALRRGIDRLADLVRPTLGPTPRCVAVAGATESRPPEILDDGAKILRRMIQLTDPYDDMGAMLLRHTLWQVHQSVGDGTATTAVLMQSMVEQGIRYVTAGGHPESLRRGLKRGLSIVLAGLRRQARPLEGAREISRVAGTLCHDAEMAALLGEIMDLVGPDGYVKVQRRNSRGLDRQYVEGVHWQEGYFSSYFVTDPLKPEVTLENPAIVISDLRLSTAEELAPLLGSMAEIDQRSLLIIAQQVSGSALALMLANNQAGKLRLLAVKAPSYGTQQAGSLEDIAVLTGGRVVTRAAAQRGQDISLSDLGYARMAWANASSFGVLGGKGNPVKLRERVAQVKGELGTSEGNDEQARVRERLSKLLGGIAILQVGAATKTELEARMATAKRAVKSLSLALAGGVVPGGGTAYLACQTDLENEVTQSDGEQVGLKILSRALEEPTRVIAENGGHDPAVAVAQIETSASGWGFDGRTGQVVDMWTEGILDPAGVVEAALEAAVSGAVMALTTDVLVHHRQAKPVIEP